MAVTALSRAVYLAAATVVLRGDGRPVVESIWSLGLSQRALTQDVDAELVVPGVAAKE
jgi:hypothetical protein